jgi:putative transposase
MTTSKRSTKLSAVEAVAGDRDLMKALMKEALQEVLEGEMTEFLGAEPGERTEARNGYRAGYYGRNLVTRIGKLELRVPRDRGGEFSTALFERYARSEKALVAALAEMYVQGVSTRKVKTITEELCGHSFSASTISAINKGLDEALARFAHRPLDEPYPYLILDARYERVRDSGVIAHQAVLIAIGINWEGKRQVLAVEMANRESQSSWKDFLLRLEGTRPVGRRIRRLRRPCRAEEGDLRGSDGSGLAALLCAFSEERPGLPAEKGRRRLSSGIALDL